MKQVEQSNEVAEMEELFSKMSKDEFLWILQELRVYKTNFVKQMRISPETLKTILKNQADEIPFYLSKAILEYTKSYTELKYLRNKYSFQKQN